MGRLPWPREGLQRAGTGNAIATVLTLNEQLRLFTRIVIFKSSSFSDSCQSDRFLLVLQSLKRAAAIDANNAELFRLTAAFYHAGMFESHNYTSASPGLFLHPI